MMKYFWIKKSVPVHNMTQDMIAPARSTTRTISKHSVKIFFQSLTRVWSASHGLNRKTKSICDFWEGGIFPPSSLSDTTTTTTTLLVLPFPYTCQFLVLLVVWCAVFVVIVAVVIILNATKKVAKAIWHYERAMKGITYKNCHIHIHLARTICC